MTISPKKILGIETSCDETAAAVLSFDSAQDKKKKIKILSNIVASSSELQAKYGGIIPEQAAREQLKAIIPTVSEALLRARLSFKDLDAIAVTQGPGLIGSLLVGVETAKVLAKVWQKPLVPVNHLIGHFYANWISQSTDYRLQSTAKKQAVVGSRKSESIPTFPCLGLLASGGHTDLVLFEGHNKFKYLGGTRDDAAGECFDKCARLLGLPYPGGPEISKLAKSGNPKAFNLPRPMITTDDFDFSYSGLKTAVANLVSEKLRRTQINSKSENQRNWSSENLSLSESFRIDLCASIEQAIIDPLVVKTIKAAKEYGVNCIILGGGVAANQKLINDLRLRIKKSGDQIKLFVPPPILCTDNAAMIASAAFFQKEVQNQNLIQANPNLSLAY